MDEEDWREEYCQYEEYLEEREIGYVEDELDGLLYDIPFRGDVDWGVLGGCLLESVLIKYPQLVGLCNLRGLGGANWLKVIEKRPEFVWHMLHVYSEADDSVVSCMDADFWLKLFDLCPGVKEICPWGRFGESLLVAIVCGGNGEYDHYVDFSKVKSTYGWVGILRNRVGFADRCPCWGSFSAWDWVSLLEYQPQLENRLDWRIFDSHYWSLLLQVRPEFISRCPVGDILSDCWRAILIAQPGLIVYCPCVDKISSRSWKLILMVQPHLAGYCDLKIFSYDDWGYLINGQVCLAAVCPISISDVYFWSCISNLGWIDYFDWVGSMEIIRRMEQVSFERYILRWKPELICVRLGEQ